MPIKQTAQDRSNSKYLLIADHIRQGILSGNLPPGTLLPQREKLALKYKTTFATLQRAINTLLADGFLTAKGRVGTHVAENPPHLTHYGLVFPYVTGQMQHLSPFWNVIRDEAVYHAKNNNCRVSVYYSGANDNRSFDYHDLNRDIAAHRLAGLIFTMPPESLRGSPAADDLTIPRVVIGEGYPSNNTQSFVWFDIDHLLKRSFEHMNQSGINKVSVIRLCGMSYSNNINNPIIECARKHRIICPDKWIFNCPVNYPECVRQYTQLLMSVPLKDRPEGIIITDESFLNECLCGLHAAGISPGRDVKILSHISYGRYNPTQSGVNRVGFDIRSAFKQCIKLIDKSRAGKKIKKNHLLPALFEEELLNTEFYHIPPSPHSI